MNCSHSPILESIQANVRKIPDKIALIAGETQVSYSILFSHIRRSASFLVSLGLKKGDKIMLSANKELDFVYLYFAAHLLGIQNVVIDPSSNSDRTAYIIQLINPAVLFGFEYVGYISYSYQNINILDYEEIKEFTIDQSINDVADIMFTTGTTGLPKGVILSHNNIFSSAKNINSFIGNSENDVEVLGLPICHSFGLGRLRCNLIKGSTIILLGSFANIKLFFNTIEQFRVTGFGMVPAVWAYIKKFSGTRIGKYSDQIMYIEIGSAAMPMADKELLIKLFPNARICMHYGLTEASRAIFTEFHSNANNLASIGKPVCQDVFVKVFDEQGNELPSGEAGEICVSGNMVMKSYYLAQDNENAFWGLYFRTGDWGYMDDAGNFYLVSRKKELINVGGKKVNPIEIEEAIISLGFEDCACVSEPDAILGEVPKAFVVKGNSNIALNEISGLLVSRLEAYKIPALYQWIEAIPKTSSGKKQRLFLQK